MSTNENDVYRAYCAGLPLPEGYRLVHEADILSDDGWKIAIVDGPHGRFRMGPNSDLNSLIERHEAVLRDLRLARDLMTQHGETGTEKCPASSPG